MKNDKKESIDMFFLVLKVVIFGLLSGFIGMMASATLTPPTDLSGDILKAMLAGFFMMIVAAIAVIYHHNRKREKANKSK